MNGLKYINELRESNHRIRELAGEIQSFENNRLHLETLIEEQSKIDAHYAFLLKQWESQYLPAIETRQNMRNELYLAKTQFETYRAILFDELKGLRVEEIKERIIELQTNHNCSVLPEYSNSADTSSTDSMVSAPVTVSDATSVAEDIQYRYKLMQTDGTLQEFELIQKNEVTEEDGIKQKGKVRSQPRFSWTLSSASSKLSDLEQTKSDISIKKRSLGSRTCELTARLKALSEQTESLTMAMRLPPRSFYSSVEAELRPYKVQIFEDYLKQKSLKDSNGSGRAFFTQSRHNQHFRSESSHTKESTPSWAISINTSMTDLSSLGNDFLKSTEESLNQISVNWI